MADNDSRNKPAGKSAANPVRRTLLKGTAGILAAGTFPAIHARDKVVLRYLGTAVNQATAIAKKSNLFPCATVCPPATSWALTANV